MKPSAVIFFSKGLPSYVFCTLFQANESNPTIPIYLISDVNPILPFVKWESLEQFSSSWQRFAKAYVHLNTCAEWLTRIWFYRWFAIYSLMKKYNLRDCVHLDTDVLLLSPFQNLNIPQQRGKMGVCSVKGGPFSGHCSVIDSAETLKLFLDFCEQMYEDPAKLDILRNFYSRQKGRPGGGGICDMYAFGWAGGWRGTTETILPLFELNDPETIGVAIDQSITDDRTCSDNSYYAMEFGLKKIVFKNGWNFVKNHETGLIPTLTIHFQGTDKHLMLRYMSRKTFHFRWTYWKHRTCEQTVALKHFILFHSEQKITSIIKKILR